MLSVQTFPAREVDEGANQLGRIGGFSLYAGVAENTRERKKLERICLGGLAGIPLALRYRQARLELTDQGKPSANVEADRQEELVPRVSKHKG